MLMKLSSKRRRSRKQIQKDKLDAQEKEAQIKSKLQRMEEMELRMQDLQEKARNNDKIQAEVHAIFQKGILKYDPQGNLLVVQDQKEQAQLQQENLLKAQKAAEEYERQRRERRQSQIFSIGAASNDNGQEEKDIDDFA